MLRILVVDDSKMARKRVIEIVSKMDISFTIIGEAEDGNIGLEKLKALKPNLVLTDLEMPNMGGIELIAKVREINLSLHIIVISALVNEQIIQTLKHDRFLDLIKKPMDTNRLQNLLSKVEHQLDKGVII